MNQSINQSITVLNIIKNSQVLGCLKKFTRYNLLVILPLSNQNMEANLLVILPLSNQNREEEVI